MAELQKQIAVLDQDSNKATWLQVFHLSLVGGFCRGVVYARKPVPGVISMDLYWDMPRRISHNSSVLNDRRCERIHEWQS